MKNNKSIFVVAVAFILIATSCNLPSNINDEQPLEAVNTKVALTLTSSALLSPPTSTPTSTQMSEPPTAVPPTATSAPVEVLPSATPNGSFFVVDVGANCRSGPDTVYDIITSFTAGAYLPLTGHNSDSSWWYVSTGSSNCWISASTGHVSGPTGSLPVVAAPPTPTAPATNGPLLSNPVALVAELSYPSNCTSNTIQVAIRVTDNGKGIDSVSLKYRYLGDGGYTGGWHTVAANDNASGGIYGFNYAIGTEAATELGSQNGTFQYQFVAKDSVGNTSSYPIDSVLGMPIKNCP